MPKANRQVFLQRFNSISEDGKSPTNSPTNKIFSSQFNSTAQTKKIIDRLQKQNKVQKQKREEIQNKYESFKERFVNREREFYRILQKFNATKQNDTKDDIYISEIYQKILCTFDAFNQKARELLDDRYSELYRLMQRRIDILMQKMDKQLSKYRKISQAERKQIQQAMKEIGSIAAQTQNQNIQFRKKNSQLHLRLEMLNQQKKLLLQEITGLKAHLSKITQQQCPRGKKNFPKNNETEIWDNAQSIKMEMLKDKKYKNGRVLTARNNRYSQKSSIENIKGNKFSTFKTIDIVKNQRWVSSNQQNIINHLKQSLQRQKKKNLQLVRFSLQLEAKQKKIKQLIFEQIQKQKTRSSQKSLSHSMNQFQYCSNKIKMFQKSTQNEKKQDDITTHVQLFNQQKQLMALSVKNQKEKNKELNQKKQLSILITEINKILHLPQNMKNDTKTLLNHEDMILNSEKQQNYQQKNRYSIDKKDIKNQYVYNNSSHRRKLSARKSIQTSRSKLSNRSIVLNENQSRKNVKNPIFMNYSPLDIDDITRSIEIK